MRHGIISVLVTTMLIATGASAQVITTWTNGGAGSDWGTVLNWDLGVPTVGDEAIISANGPVAITGAATADVVDLRGGQTINQTGGTLTINTNIKVGRGAGESGFYNLSAGSITSTIAANGQIQVARDPGSTGTFSITGTGTVDLSGGSGGAHSSAMYVGTYGGVGICNLNSATGQLKAAQFSIGYAGSWTGQGAGTVNHDAGTLTSSWVEIGTGWDDNGFGIYNLDGGTLDVTDTTYGGLLIIGNRAVGAGARAGTGTMHQTGGAVDVLGGIYIGAASGYTAAYNFTGGTISDGTNDAFMVVRYDPDATGTFQGQGTVGLSGALENNGRIIADGGTLNMASFTSVDNTIENTTTNGWYAVNGGKLELPTIAVTGDGSYNWGEATADTTLDLVNSARLTFNGVSAGNLDIALLDIAHADAPPNMDLWNSVAGLWDIDYSAAFTSIDLTLRYDDALAGNLANLALYHYTGGEWERVDFVIDPTNHLISVSGLTSLSPFAAGHIPEPASGLLLLLPALALLRRRK